MTVPTPAGSGASEARRARNAPPLIGLLGLLGIVLVVVVASFFGNAESRIADPLADLDTASSGGRLEPVELEGAPDEVDDFTRALLADIDTAWTRMFADSGHEYHETTRVIFREFTDSACGGADEDMGAHYCVGDETLYLDEAFFDRVFEGREEGAEGTFAEAWLLAHLVGHHIQHQLGITERVSELDENGTSGLFELVELQADCLAGVWAFTLAQRGTLVGEDDLQASTALLADIGSQRVSAVAPGNLRAETWGHATPDDRVAWFVRGYQSGDPAQCDPFEDG
jgi:predicted metalloprotease